jgi:hypothetical protein
VIALWLGHESVETTQIYLEANLKMKEEILAKTTPVEGKPGRYRPDDQLLAFLLTRGRFLKTRSRYISVSLVVFAQQLQEILVYLLLVFKKRPPVKARHSSQIRDNQTQNRRSFVLIAGRFWVRFRMASCCRKARFSKAKLHRPLSVALKKQHSKDSNSLIPIECRARP